MEAKTIITNEDIRQTVARGKSYCLVLLKAGPNRNQSPSEQDQIRMEHLRYLFGLRAEGKLILNGPVTDDAQLVGIGICTSNDKEDVQALMAGDPGVKAGWLAYEVHMWFSIPGNYILPA